MCLTVRNKHLIRGDKINIPTNAEMEVLYANYIGGKYAWSQLWTFNISRKFLVITSRTSVFPDTCSLYDTYKLESNYLRVLIN
jgi:hypothetical protein